MKYRTRTYYNDAQKAMMWERWKQGWTLHQIAHLFDRAHGSIRGIFDQTGGFRPPQRSRSPIALTLAEREEISRSVAEGQSIRSMAARLGRAPSTLSREIRRNGGQANYRATEADNAAWDRALRPKCCKLADNRVSGAARDRQAPAAVVTPTDRRLAQACLPGRREPSRVTRDHLSHPVHPGARCPEEGAAPALEAHPRHASVAAPHAKDRHSRADRRCRVDQRTPGVC